MSSFVSGGQNWCAEDLFRDDGGGLFGLSLDLVTSRPRPFRCLNLLHAPNTFHLAITLRPSYECSSSVPSSQIPIATILHGEHCGLEYLHPWDKLLKMGDCFCVCSYLLKLHLTPSVPVFPLLSIANTRP
jgi:hypothetical protein